MPTYTPGSAKQNPENKAVAVRTIFPDMPDFADRQWGVMTVNNGGHYATYDMVADWPDIQPIPGWAPPQPEATPGDVPLAVPEDTVEADPEADTNSSAAQ